MAQENQTTCDWHGCDLEYYGELENILRCVPNNCRFSLIATDRALRRLRTVSSQTCDALSRPPQGPASSRPVLMASFQVTAI